MTALATILAAALAAQTSPAPAGAAPPAADAASEVARAAAAADRAAAAAERAAAAAQAAADAAAKVLAVMPATATLPVAAPAAVAPPAPPPPSAWTSVVGLGLVSLSGNTRSVTFTGNGAVERKGPEWIFRAKGNLQYGESRLAAGGYETVAEAAGLMLRADREFGKRYSAYVLGGAEGDHVKSIELRTSAEAGGSLVFFDSGGDALWKTYLRGDLGFRFADERRYQYFPTPAPLPAVDLYAPRAGVAFRYLVVKDLLLTEDAEVLSNVVGDSRWLVNSVTKLLMRFSKTLAFGVAYTVNHDTAPAPGKVDTDTQLALTLDVLL